MRFVPGRTFAMGSNHNYPEERPVRHVNVDGFWMDRAPVTNAEFSAFVAETDYRTMAERPPSQVDFPDVPPESLVPGSAVFCPPKSPVALDREDRWWRYIPGASWRSPNGPGSTIAGLELHPVVHVAYEDGLAYARWAGKALPTEEEWELAARGGHDGLEFAWGEELNPEGRWMANTWQGEFPWQNLGLDGYEGTSPVGSFPPNPFDLVDMIGNVWEWTTGASPVSADRACCAPPTLRPVRRQRIIKGGSYLCSPNYCARYRPAARQLLESDSSASHVGFRCALRPSPQPAGAQLL